MILDTLLTWRHSSYLLAFLLVAQSILVLYGLNSTPPAFRSKSGIQHQIHGLDHESVLDSATSSELSLPHELPDTLSTTQCDSEFPNLYYEVDRAASYWKERKHIISKDDVDISWQPTEWYSGGAIRVLIHDNRLRILESINSLRLSGYQERSLGILNLLHRALESATAGGEKLPTIEAAIVLQDLSWPPTQNGTETFWTWTRELGNSTYDRLWLIPNFDFWAAKGLGSYRDARLEAFARDKVEKIPKVIWRGNPVNENINEKLRSRLLNMTEGKQWADVHYYNVSTGENSMPIRDMCNYTMTVHTEGYTYSGRLKFLLNCNSLPFVHELNYTSQYYHLLERQGPNQNYVAVARNWSDLEEKVLYYQDHPNEAQNIIANHMATFRDKYLTRAATSCYLRRLIRAYSEVSFTPEVRAPKGVGSTDLRGRPFEVYMNSPEDFLEPK
ncbi:Protein O-glucosyltransferase 2 [Pseudocercospora fuligena]|uniref:Protein O-glucosyltransferase 2 n=1 Tax=Pseudocercospora fuligena TaxID=685502 RepID=A0A8H6VEU6_9PEZI|nr:Protein O-glucosyltransferase 2 [Pseudocercospora fuligena]